MSILQLVFNPLTSRFDYINSSNSTGSFVDAEVPVGAINSSNKIFTIASTPTSGSVHVYLNGARQELTNDYTFSGTTITFISAPLTNSNLFVDYRTDNGTTNFADGEVPTGAVNGSNLIFTTANTPATGSVHVYLNGERQLLTTDYTFSGTTITFISAPLTNSNLIVDYRY